MNMDDHDVTKSLMTVMRCVSDYFRDKDVNSHSEIQPEPCSVSSVNMCPGTQKCRVDSVITDKL